MKQSKELSPNLFSNRAKLILSEAQANQTTLKANTFVNEKNHQNWIWNFELGDDKILTLSYQFFSGNQLHLLFLECLTRISFEKTILFVQKISFREVENFLRDENHLTAFSIEDFEAFEADFKMIQKSLLVALLIRRLESELNLDIATLFINWSHLSLVFKNSKALILVNTLNKILPTNNALQLVMAENATLSIILNDFPMEISILQKLMDEVFRRLNQDSSLKVVAVQ